MMPQPPPAVVPPLLEPKRIKAFGVIHIVFGSLGLLWSGMAFLMAFVMGPLMDLMVGQATKESDAADPATKAMMGMFEAMKTMMSEMLVLNLAKGLMGLIVSILILIAGIKLVKRRKKSVGGSNLYAWSSLGAKVVYLGLFFMIGVPAMKKYYAAMEGLVEAAGAPAGGGMGMMQFQQALGIGGQVVVVCLGAVYPLLALLLLNKPIVKDYLAQQGT